MPLDLALILAGACGAIAKDIVSDGKLKLPSINNDDLVLGFIGGAIVGAFVGWAVDHSILTAALSGYVGSSAIQHLLPPLPSDKPPEEKHSVTTTTLVETINKPLVIDPVLSVHP